ncbi:hypothetical protein AAGG74_18835 [Bacillus mexicanus]|uniref:hypothetical protein n=1 Tax=Bacillus mexicanus TaxID=2834415 RepID=UPI003D190D7B
MSRVEKFYQSKIFQEMSGLPEKIIEKEEELEESLGDNLILSKKEYEDGKLILGKINEWYFLGNNKKKFKVFEDKRMFLLFIKQEFERATEHNTQGIDPSWKGFWAREVESL